jgi:hypothetical protein
MTPTPLGASKTIDRQIGKKKNIKHTIDDLFFRLLYQEAAHTVYVAARQGNRHAFITHTHRACSIHLYTYCLCPIDSTYESKTLISLRLFQTSLAVFPFIRFYDIFSSRESLNEFVLN